MRGLARRILALLGGMSRATAGDAELDLRRRSPSAGENVFPLFVSSTFRDMHGEREVLRRSVFPIVRRTCEDRGVAFLEIDLRWGVTQKEAEAGNVLPICLNEVDRARPYVLGFLGAQYGWVDPRAADLLAQAPRFSALVPYADRSVTEIELRYSILQRPPESPAPVALIYRRPGVSTEHGTASGFGSLLADLDAAELAVHETPADLEQFADIVRRDLLHLVDLHFGTVSPLAGERSSPTAREFAALLGHRYIERSAAQSLVKAAAEKRPRVALVGAAGSGKSMIAAALVRWAASDRRSNIIAALRPGGWRDWTAALSDIVAQLRSQQTAADNQNAGAGDVRSDFLTVLSAAAERRHIVVVIDGVDDGNLSATELPAWWPVAVDNATIVVTARRDPAAVAALKRAGWHVIAVEAKLTPSEASQLTAQHLSVLGRRLDDHHLDALIRVPRSVFELSLAVDELLSVPRFEMLDAELERLAGLRGLAPIVDATIDRLVREHGSPAETVLGALALAPDGLPPPALQVIAGEPGAPLAPLPFARLREALGGLVAVGPTRAVLRSSLLNTLVLTRFAADATEGLRLRIVKCLRLDLGVLGAVEEVLRQYVLMKDWKAVAELLQDPRAFDALAGRAPQQLRFYWAILRSVDSTYGPFLYLPWADCEPVDRVARAAALADDLGDMQTAGVLAEAARRRADRNDEPTHARVLTVLAAIAEADGDFARASELLDEIEQRQVAGEMPQIGAAAAVRRAQIELLRRGPAQAEPMIAAAAAAVVRAGDIRLQATLDTIRAAVALEMRDLRTAGKIGQELQALGDRLGDLSVLAAGFVISAKVERQRGKLRHAAASAAQAQRFAEIAGDDRVLQDALGIAARIAIEDNRPSDARQLIKRRRTLTREIQDIIGEMETEIDHVRWYVHMGDERQAQLVAQGVAERARRFGLEGIASLLEGNDRAR
jgi:Domain of unknown function (DUF4062)